MPSCAEGRGGVQGVVFKADGAPAGDVTIRVRRAEGDPAALITTGEDGGYEINNLLAGVWTLEFYGTSGVMDGSESITVSGGQTVTLDYVIGQGDAPGFTGVIGNTP
jgi:hypothetical protein